MTPGIYIALTTFNQEMIPLDLLTSFASQRSTVPFPAIFEAILMFLSFEILRESDYRIPNISNSALSIVGALILGEAAVNAGIVSPIMIIIVAITAISALIITEPELTNAVKWYRILFMIGGTSIGMFGIFIVFIIFITNLCNINSFGYSYMMPFVSINADIKNSLIKFPLRSRTKRNKYLTNNITREVNHEKIKYLSILLIIPLLSGCYNYRELNELAITTALSIDYSDNNFNIIVEVINPTKQQDAVSANNSPFVNYYSSAPTLQDALRNVVIDSPRQLYAAQLELIILSEEAATNHMPEILEYFSREPESRTEVKFVIARGDDSTKAVTIQTLLTNFSSSNIKQSLELQQKYSV